jgi:hypothetical protein
VGHCGHWAWNASAPIGVVVRHGRLAITTHRSSRDDVPNPGVRLDVDGVILFPGDVHRHRAPGTTIGPEVSNGIPVQRRQSAIVPGTTMLVRATFSIRPPARTCIRKK